MSDGGDNCPTVANASQVDTDHDHHGNPCDKNDDNDNRPDVSDNCVTVKNPAQIDRDHDGHGDACDRTPTGTDD